MRVGDKVRRIGGENHYDMKRGEVYTISSVGSSNVGVEENERTWMNEYFEVVGKKNPTFKEIVDALNAGNLWVDTPTLITEKSLKVMKVTFRAYYNSGYYDLAADKLGAFYFSDPTVDDEKEELRKNIEKIRAELKEMEDRLDS